MLPWFSFEALRAKQGDRDQVLYIASYFCFGLNFFEVLDGVIALFSLGVTFLLYWGLAQARVLWVLASNSPQAPMSQGWLTFPLRELATIAGSPTSHRIKAGLLGLALGLSLVPSFLLAPASLYGLGREMVTLPSPYQPLRELGCGALLAAGLLALPGFRKSGQRLVLLLTLLLPLFTNSGVLWQLMVIPALVVGELRMRLTFLRIFNRGRAADF